MLSRVLFRVLSKAVENVRPRALSVLFRCRPKETQHPAGAPCRVLFRVGLIAWNPVLSRCCLANVPTCRVLFSMQLGNFRHLLFGVLFQLLFRDVLAATCWSALQGAVRDVANVQGQPRACLVQGTVQPGARMQFTVRFRVCKQQKVGTQGVLSPKQRQYIEKADSLFHT